MAKLENLEKEKRKFLEKKDRDLKKMVEELKTINMASALSYANPKVSKKRKNANSNPSRKKRKPSPSVTPTQPQENKSRSIPSQSRRERVARVIGELLALSQDGVVSIIDVLGEIPEANEGDIKAVVKASRAYQMLGFADIAFIAEWNTLEYDLIIIKSKIDEANQSIKFSELLNVTKEPLARIGSSNLFQHIACVYLCVHLKSRFSIETLTDKDMLHIDLQSLQNVKISRKQRTVKDTSKIFEEVAKEVMSERSRRVREKRKQPDQPSPPPAPRRTRRPQKDPQKILVMRQLNAKFDSGTSGECTVDELMKFMKDNDREINREDLLKQVRQLDEEGKVFYVADDQKLHRIN